MTHRKSDTTTPAKPGLRRRQFTGGLALGSLAFGASAQTAAPAQGFPDRPIRIVVPYAAGGPSDTVTRVVGQRMSQFLGQPVAVENRAGASGLIGMEYVVRQPGDGYTMVMFSQGGSVLNTATREKMPYDLLKDFRAIGNMAVMPQVAVISNNIPARTLAEFVAYAKANRGKLSFGSSGTGSSPHLMGELLKATTGIDMVHVPYKGTGPATIDLISNQIQFLYTEVPVLIENIRNGSIRAIAISTPRRSPLLPNVPTMEEAGFPQFTGANWFGLAVPSSTPTPVVNILNSALVRALDHPDTRASLTGQGAYADPGPAEKFDKFLRDEVERWRGIMRTTKVKVH